MKVEKDTIPRRHRVDLFTPVEKAIYELQGEVEKMGADVRLTDALNLLIQARWKIADFVDGVQPIEQPKPTAKEPQTAEEILYCVMFNPCTYESCAGLISVHSSKKEAEIALEYSKQEFIKEHERELESDEVYFIAEYSFKYVRQSQV